MQKAQNFVKVSEAQSCYEQSNNFSKQENAQSLHCERSQKRFIFGKGVQEQMSFKHKLITESIEEEFPDEGIEGDEGLNLPYVNKIN